MIDHLSITVADLDRSTQFYGAVMATFVLDPDGNRIEAVWPRPAGQRVCFPNPHGSL